MDYTCDPAHPRTKVNRMIPRLGRAILAGCLFAAGCHLPVSTAIPETPATVGRGHWGVLLAAGHPTVNLLATVQGEPDPADPHHYSRADWPSFQLRLARGVSDHVDVELGVEGMMYVLPIPFGASLGVRHRFYTTNSTDMTWSGRVGYAAARDAASADEASIVYGVLACNADTEGWRGLRPGLAVSIMPMRVDPDLETFPIDEFYAVASSVTFKLALGPNVIPFAHAGLITSSNVRGTDLFLGLGLALSWGAERRKVPLDTARQVP